MTAQFGKQLGGKLAVAALLLVMSGCGSAAQPAVSTPSKPASASVPVSPASQASAAPASAASAKPQASAQTSAAGQPASWDQVLAAAKAEGQIVIRSQSGQTVADALTVGFSKAYPDIKVDYSGAGGSETVTKLVTERQANRFTVDVGLHGTTTLFDMMKADALDPIAQYLVGPQTQELSKWMGGKYTYADDAGKYVIMLTAGVSVPFIYNPTVVPKADFKSWKDLLNPKYKGKLAMFDPMVAGNGTAMAQFLYVTPSLGKDYLQTLFSQQGVILSRDDRQLSDWVGRNQYPIGIAAQGFEALALKKQGVPIDFMSADQLQEGSFLTTSFGSVAVMNKAPHPNAVKVYLNWLLSKEGQESLSKASGYPSRRTDADTSGLIPETIPTAGKDYVELNKESYVRSRAETTDFLKTVIKQ